MKKPTYILVFLVLLLSIALSAQTVPTGYWFTISEGALQLKGKRQIVPQKYLTFHLKVEQLRSILFSAPHEERVKINESNCVIELPLPDGSIQRFKVVESPIMAKELVATFPDIKTLSVKGIDDIYANGKIDMNEFGFHGMIFSASGDYFIDPYCVGNTGDYISYFKKDFVKDPSQIIPEAGVIDAEKKVDGTEKKSETGTEPSKRPAAPCTGGQLRTFRLAIACTGEYAVAATGFTAPTVGQALAKVVTSINRVDGVYEKELAIRLELVPTTTLVIYTDGATDSFTGSANTNPNTLINLSQSIITNSIGVLNFDIGHTFSTGAGGLANLGCACNATQKARGVTGLSNPVGDPYDIDFVAHEIGHQFGAHHTFNALTDNCNGNRDAATSVEPGSGITIMGYAGICSINNLGVNSIPYFHGISYDEIINYVTAGNGASCAFVTTAANQPPSVTAQGNYVIPKSTPFSLTGFATDPDGDVLTYSWEETDPGTTGGNWNSGNKPFFRSYAPTASPTRFFPKESVVLSGNYTGTIGEYLPASAQVLNFRLTARDNKMGGGGVCKATAQITVDAEGPFKVTYPSSSQIFWFTGSQKGVTWDISGTDSPPVSCDSVRILLSNNSGATYSVLVNSAVNDGYKQVTVPTIVGMISTCRIKVQSIGNVFYDISDNDFTISDDPLAGIQSISQNDPFLLNVWPNPNSGLLNFSVSNLNGGSATTVAIMDLLGRTVLQKKYSARIELRDALDISELGNGVYFVKVNNEGNQSLHRIVKD